MTIKDYDELYDEMTAVVGAFFSVVDCHICNNQHKEEVCKYCCNYKDGTLLYTASDTHKHKLTTELIKIVKEHETLN